MDENKIKDEAISKATKEVQISLCTGVRGHRESWHCIQKKESMPDH